MTDKNAITNDSGDPKYYILTPQIVLARCDTPYEYTLWNVIKNIAGELGECFISTEDLAILSMMSTGKCSESRQSLIAKGLLTGELRKDPEYPQPVWHLTIPNLWQENTKWRESHQSLKDRIKLKKKKNEEYKKSLRKAKPSLSEGGIPPREGGIPPRETKNNQQEEPEGITIGKPNGLPTVSQTKKLPTKQPKPVKTDKPTDKQLQPRKELFTYFTDYTKLTPPANSQDQGYWYKNIGEILAISNQDLPTARRLIKQSVDKLRADDLTISTPGSLVKTIRALAANGNTGKVRMTAV